MSEPQEKNSGPTSPSGSLLHEALASHQAGRLEDAERLYGDVLREQPGQFDCLHLLGFIAYQRGEFSDAVGKIDAALAINPNAAAAHNNRGAALGALKRHDEALASHDRALALKPGYFEAFSNRATVLSALKRHDEALAACEQAIALKPDFAEAHYNRGNALRALKRFEQALASYDQAIVHKQDYGEALSGRGAMLRELNRLPEALAAYERAAALKPDLKYLLGDHLYAKLSLCHWNEFEEHCARIEVAIAHGAACASPFQLMATRIGPADQLRCAKRIVEEEFSNRPISLWRGERYTHDRIRVAYVSADFRDHPVSILIAGLFAEHDRTRFEVFGIGFGADDPSRCVRV